MAKIKDVVARGEEYQDRNGNQKVRWINCGAMFKNNEGKVSIKLDSLPVNFDGWLSLFDPKPRKEAAPQTENPAPFDDDLPF